MNFIKILMVILSRNSFPAILFILFLQKCDNFQMFSLTINIWTGIARHLHTQSSKSTTTCVAGGANLPAFGGFAAVKAKARQCFFRYG